MPCRRGHDDSVGLMITNKRWNKYCTNMIVDPAGMHHWQLEKADVRGATHTGLFFFPGDGKSYYRL